MTDFKAVADIITDEIASGRLRPGERLPPQREFAHAKRIAASTAARVYAELGRRGLVVGEVGRGTFVLDGRTRSDPPLVEPTLLPIDLEMVFALPAGCGELITRNIAAWASSHGGAALRPVGASGTAELKEVCALFFARSEWVPDPSRLLFTGSGKQAIAAALSALAPPGARVGVESITYPVVKGIAARFGITLVPLPMDEEGLLPEAVAEAHRSKPLAAVYLQPLLQNPLGCSMSAGRRRSWARLLEEENLTAVEDGVYSFLAPQEPPLASLAPDRVVLIDSLSKRASPGATLGIISAPKHLLAPLAVAIRGGAWLASGVSMAMGIQWMSCGEAAIVQGLKQADASLRQALAHEILGPAGLRSDRRSYHAWLPLPDALRAEIFVARALRRGIAITAGSAFTVGQGYSPPGVRLAFGSPELSELSAALNTLHELLIHNHGEEAVE